MESTRRGKDLGRSRAHEWPEASGKDSDGEDLDAVFAEMTARWHQSDVLLEMEQNVRGRGRISGDVSGICDPV